MAGCCKNCFKILTICFAFLDIGVGWWKFTQIYLEASHLESDWDTLSAHRKCKCENPRLFWILCLSFEIAGTGLAALEIYYLYKELRKDKSIFNECFSKAFCVVVAIYVLGVFPSSIIDIVFRARCICNGKFSIHAWQWSSEFFKGLTGGLSVIFLQIILHLADVFYRLRRLWRCLGTCLLCKEFAPDGENERMKPCFVISILLAIIYAVIFVAEIVYMFCERYD